MTSQEYAFLVVAVVGSVSAVAVVTARNVVHAALYLVVTLLSVGVTFLLLGAEFVGWVQILIYVGAIVILFLFGLMLTKAPIGRDTLDNQQRGIGALVGLLVFIGLVALIQNAFPLADAVAPPAASGASGVIGEALFKDYVLPFEDEGE
jgi:NADH-quinone oxidoreductase subunit J